MQFVKYVVRKGFDMKYDFSSVPLKKRKNVVTTKTTKTTFFREKRGKYNIIMRGYVHTCV